MPEGNIFMLIIFLWVILVIYTLRIKKNILKLYSKFNSKLLFSFHVLFLIVCLVYIILQLDQKLFVEVIAYFHQQQWWLVIINEVSVQVQFLWKPPLILLTFVTFFLSTSFVLIAHFLCTFMLFYFAHLRNVAKPSNKILHHLLRCYGSQRSDLL